MVKNSTPESGVYSRSLLRWGLLSAVLVAATACVVIMMIPGGHANAASGQAMTPSPSVLNHYAVFSRAQSTADAVPTASTLLARPEIVSSTALTRHQPTSDPTYAQWAAVEGERLCVVDQFTPASAPNSEAGANKACNGAQYLEDHHQLIVQASYTGGTSGTAPEPGVANVVSGLAPNGVSDVTLIFADGTEQSVPVIENGFLYSLSTAQKLANVTWTVSGKTFGEKE